MYCTENKSIATRAPLGQNIVCEAMKKVSLDILGALPLTENGNKQIR
jgi:hypothetical protein